MKALFLGTGTSQGVPMVGCDCAVCKSKNSKDIRLRSSLLVYVNGCSILIDIGPDFRYQMLRANISSIDSILLTHQHRDHTAGLDDIRPVYYKYKKPINIYAEYSVCESIKMDFRYLFSGVNYPGKPKLNFQIIDLEPFYLNNIKITPIRAMHYKLPVLGFRIGNMSYVTDANYISSEEKNKLLNSDVLIINSLQKDKHISHYSLEDSIQLIQDLKPKKAYLTHIGHGMGIHEMVEKELPENVFLAYDNLCLQLK